MFRNTRGNKYLRIKVFGKAYSCHRIIWLYLYGRFPSFEIDHINGDGLDNSSKNLRDVDCSHNQKNRQIGRDNTSGHIGIFWSKDSRKWRVGLKHYGKKIHVGLFAQIDDAIKARDVAYKEYGYHKNHGRKGL